MGGLLLTGVTGASVASVAASVATFGGRDPRRAAKGQPLTLVIAFFNRKQFKHSAKERVLKLYSVIVCV